MAVTDAAVTDRREKPRRTSGWSRRRGQSGCA